MKKRKRVKSDILFIYLVAFIVLTPFIDYLAKAYDNKYIFLIPSIIELINIIIINRRITKGNL